MDVKIQMCSSQRFFMSMSYSPNLTLPLSLKGWRGGEQQEEKGGYSHSTPNFFFSLATSPVCLNSCSLTGLDTAAQMWAHFLRSPMPKPTVLSEQSEDSRVPGIKITADKWGSKWRHTSALSSKFAARFQNVGIRSPFWWSQGWEANLNVSEK